MNENWEVYPSRVNGSPAIILIDMGLKEPIDKFQELVTVCVNLLNPQENGFPNQDEFEALEKIETDLGGLFVTSMQGVYVGRLTTAGQRAFYFYTKNAEKVTKSFKAFLSQYEEYTFTIDIKHDPDWSTYFGLLYPTPLEQQYIKNRELTERLKENGDTLTVPRKVEHRIFFKNADDRESFKQRAEEHGFQVSKVINGDDNDTFPFGVYMSRMDSIDLSTIDATVTDIFNLTHNVEGTYAGWESLIK